MKPSPLLDTSITIETPEAIDITLHPASAYARSQAFLIDFLIRVVWLGVSSMAAYMIFSPSILEALLLLNIFFTFWLYFVVFEVYNKGQTPGKKSAGIKVVADNGAPITWSASLLRNLLRMIDGLPIFYAIGISSILLSNKAQRLGDMLSGSLVVYLPEKENRKKQIKRLQNIEAIALPVHLSLLEQQAIVDFANRCATLSSARQDEVAEILVDALQLQSYHPSKTILGLAKTIVGQDKEASQ